MTDRPRSPLPLDDVPTMTLDEWDAKLGGGWDVWARIDDGSGAKVHVEQIDIEVPPDRTTYGFEVRLEVLPEAGPIEDVVRETVHNPYLALRIADDLAANAEMYITQWEEGLAPRPEAVEYRGRSGSR